LAHLTTEHKTVRLVSKSNQSNYSDVLGVIKTYLPQAKCSVSSCIAETCKNPGVEVSVDSDSTTTVSDIDIEIGNFVNGYTKAYVEAIGGT
jgi:hypothetical protein